MTQNKREIIEEEIASLERSVDKNVKDHNIVTGMINDLMDDRIGITKELISFKKMIRDRTAELGELEDQ